MSDPVLDSGIEVICGCMFSGKTEEMLRRLRRALIGQLPVQVFKHAKDNRYHESNVVSHGGASISALAVSSASELARKVHHTTRVVGIDEAQWFDNEIVNVAIRLADDGLRVIIAGLDVDYLRVPFGPIPALLAHATHIQKCQAVCLDCKRPTAIFSRRNVGVSGDLVGGAEAYSAVCRGCYMQNP